MCAVIFSHFSNIFSTSTYSAPQGCLRKAARNKQVLGGANFDTCWKKLRYKNFRGVPRGIIIYFITYPEVLGDKFFMCEYLFLILRVYYVFIFSHPYIRTRKSYLLQGKNIFYRKKTYQYLWVQLLIYKSPKIPLGTLNNILHNKYLWVH